MHSYCINKLLNLEDVIVKNVVHADDYVKIFIETKPSLHTCPNYGTQTMRTHDYRYQKIKDLPFQLKHTYLILRKRRYACSCGKHLAEKYDFVPAYHQRTQRLSYKIIDLLHGTNSIKSVAQTANVSVSTVSRLLDTVSYTSPSIPSCIAIDEFKGNAETGK